MPARNLFTSGSPGSLLPIIAIAQKKKQIVETVNARGGKAYQKGDKPRTTTIGIEFVAIWMKISLRLFAKQMSIGPEMLSANTGKPLIYPVKIGTRTYPQKKEEEVIVTPNTIIAGPIFGICDGVICLRLITTRNL